MEGNSGVAGECRGEPVGLFDGEGEIDSPPIGPELDNNGALAVELGLELETEGRPCAPSLALEFGLEFEKPSRVGDEPESAGPGRDGERGRAVRGAAMGTKTGVDAEPLCTRDEFK